MPLEASETYLSPVSFTDLTLCAWKTMYSLPISFYGHLQKQEARGPQPQLSSEQCLALVITDKQVPLKEGTTVACRPTEPERFLQENTRKELNQKEEMALR